MNAKELIEAVRSAVFERNQLDSEKFCSEQILQIDDLQDLMLIVDNAELFQGLSLTETWQLNASRQKILGDMDLLNRYIADLRVHTCTCTKYQYLSLNPEWESDDGLITITQQSTLEGGYGYECQCKNCGKRFYVTYTLDSMGYDNYAWNQN